MASSSSGGVGFSSILTVVFIVLKLTKVISWSWFWVLSPAIFHLIIAAVAIMVIIVINSRK